MLELDIDPQTVCRICLSASDKLLNLFISTVVDGYIMAVPEMVFNCLGLQVTIIPSQPTIDSELNKILIFLNRSTPLTDFPANCV